MKEKFKVKPLKENKEYEFASIAKLLRGGQLNHDNDRLAFNEYHKGQITIDECVERFKKSNRIKENIDERLFQKWLESLGY